MPESVSMALNWGAAVTILIVVLAVIFIARALIGNDGPQHLRSMLISMADGYSCFQMPLFCVGMVGTTIGLLFLILGEGAQTNPTGEMWLTGCAMVLVSVLGLLADLLVYKVADWRDDRHMSS